MGNILMFDGIALETCCSYCPIRNQVLGLCREHSNRVSTTVDNLDSIKAIHTAVFEPPTKDSGVCFGTEATVVAIAPYGQTEHYSPIPIIASPSCKTEKGAELTKWISSLLVQWKQHSSGEALHGPIWALGSDGDSAYRLAKHMECMSTELDSQDPLGKILSGLNGLNLFTSKDGILGTSDPKHIFKRKCI